MTYVTGHISEKNISLTDESRYKKLSNFLVFMTHMGTYDNMGTC